MRRFGSLPFCHCSVFNFLTPLYHLEPELLAQLPYAPDGARRPREDLHTAVKTIRKSIAQASTALPPGSPPFFGLIDIRCTIKLVLVYDSEMF